MKVCNGNSLRKYDSGKAHTFRMISLYTSINMATNRLQADLQILLFSVLSFNYLGNASEMEGRLL